MRIISRPSLRTAFLASAKEGKRSPQWKNSHAYKCSLFSYFGVLHFGLPPRSTTLRVGQTSAPDRVSRIYWWTGRESNPRPVRCASDRSGIKIVFLFFLH